jgi:trimeric autotransporter adhesin
MPLLLNKLRLLIALLVISFSAYAQAPNLLNYQGVARNSMGIPLPDQPMNLRLSVHNHTANGEVVYSETRAIITNPGGLFSVKVGSAGTTSATGTIDGVNWLSGDKYLQVEIAPSPNDNYLDLGTVQLVSVPYAFNAVTAATALTVKTNANLTGAVTSNGNLTSLAASPALTGVPTAPTAAPGTNTTQIATTEFVKATVLKGSVANVAAISETSTANGASITSGVLSLAPANATNGGVITTGAQIFAGAKTFNADLLVNGLSIGQGASSNIFNTNFPSGNTAIGNAALSSNMYGSNNAANGFNSLESNTCLVLK